MRSISDIMVVDVLSVNDTDTVYRARAVLKENGVRHLPVLDHQSGQFVGIVTQGSILNYTLKIVEKFGLSALDKRDKRNLVNEVMVTDCETANPDMELITAAEFFIKKKSSCLPVVQGSELKGIVTSVDFVKLALHLLKA